MWEKKFYFSFAEIVLVSQKPNGNTWKEKAFIKLKKELNSIASATVNFQWSWSKQSNLEKLSPPTPPHTHKLSLRQSLSYGAEGPSEWGLGARGEGCNQMKFGGWWDTVATVEAQWHGSQPRFCPEITLGYRRSPHQRLHLLPGSCP